MFDISVTERCQRILAEYIKGGDTVIDCTAGGGWDTLFLARQVGRTGCVLSFDVQQQALDATEKLLGENGFLCKRISSPYEYISSTEHNTGIYLTNDSHENLGHYYSEPSVIMYNLGYLPGGDHNIVTTAGYSAGNSKEKRYHIDSHLPRSRRGIKRRSVHQTTDRRSSRKQIRSADHRAEQPQQCPRFISDI